MFLILFLAATLMSIGALTLFDYGKSFDKRAQELNAPHLIGIIDKTYYGPAHLDYLRSDPAVKQTAAEDILFMANCSFWYGDGKNTQYIVIQNAAINRDMSPLTFIGETDCSEYYTIFAPYMLHVGGGYEVGDNFILEYGNREYSFRIGGFVEDIMLGASNMGIFGFYMPEALFKKFSAEGYALPAVLISAQLTDVALGEEVCNGFMAYCGEGKGAIWGFSLTLLKMARTMMSDLVSVLMVAFALIITVTALIVIHFRISDSIQDDIKDIGILKAMGYTNRQIKVSVLLQFLSVAVLASVAGIIASYLLISLVSLMFSIQTGLIWRQGFAPATSALCLFMVVFAVAANVFFSLRKVKSLHPIMAIRVESPKGGLKRNHFTLDRAKGGLQYLLAGKLFMENLRQNIVIALIIATVTFASAFGIVIYYNMAVNTKSFIDTIGGEICSVIVSPAANISAAKLREEIGKMKEVNQAIFFDQDITTISEEDYFVMISQDFDELCGQMLYKGNYPKSAGEVAIGGFGAAKLGKNIGDTVRISFENEEAEYVISGFIQSGNNIGRQLTLTEEGFIKLKPDYMPTEIYVYLKEGERADAFVETLVSRYGSAINKPVNMDEIIEGQSRSYVIIIELMSLVVLLITGVVVFLILYFVIKTMIVRKKRRFGIQKALGYTTFQIMQQIALGFLPVALGGALLGSVIGCFGINPLMTALFKTVGIMRFDMIISYIWLIALCIGLTILSYIIAMVITYRIRRISAYILVTE